LTGCSELWILPEREQRQRAYQHALAELAAQARASGDFAGAEKHLRRAPNDDPWSEATRRDLMQTLADSGDYPAALTVYREGMRLLHEAGPGISPQEATTALYQKLRAEAGRKPRAPRLSSSPPTITSGSVPSPLTELLGRETALQEIGARLHRNRLVTLTGTGGIGKTRLAIAVAKEVSGVFVGGAWFVDLTALSDGKLIEQTVAAALQLREVAGKSWRQTLQDYLQPKHLLLVLDNCEHLLPECRELVAGLLSACPHLHLLATSRQAFQLAGDTADTNGAVGPHASASAGA
jgi:tetratricopeptide (TPR) repeat protein